MNTDFLQTTGIASQAADAFDKERQEGRIRSQTEQANQSVLDENTLYREIVKMAYQHELQKETAKEAAKKLPGAVQLPQMRRLPQGPMDFRNGEDMQPMASRVPGLPEGIDFAERNASRVPGMANGGEVDGEKFTGIYDDAKMTGRMPTMFVHAIRDRNSDNYKYGAHYHMAIDDLVNHTNAMADGGSVDMYNGVPMYANGGPVKGANPIMTFLHSRFGAKKKGKGKGKKKMKGGGAVRGPGTGTSDSVPASGPGGQPFKLSNGEYVLSADTVRAVGKPNLDKLQAQYHKKV